MIANNLKVRRTMAKLTIGEVCEKIEISCPTYIAWEKSRRYPKVDQILELAKLFECRLDDLYSIY